MQVHVAPIDYKQVPDATVTPGWLARLLWRATGTVSLCRIRRGPCFGNMSLLNRDEQGTEDRRSVYLTPS
jgi:hypothetical protein